MTPYSNGQQQALRVLALMPPGANTKTGSALTSGAAKANVILSRLKSRLARGSGKIPLDAVKNPTWFETLFGRPTEALHPMKLLRQAASLDNTREAILAMRGLGPQGNKLWARTKGLGRLTGDVLNKSFILGMPTYATVKGLQAPPPGKTRGEAVGRALGEGLGWLPPTGWVGMSAALAAPQYSLPGLLGSLGENAGGAISQITGWR
jgi:hypothetical protein